LDRSILLRFRGKSSKRFSGTGVSPVPAQVFVRTCGYKERAMLECVPLTRKMLNNSIDLQVDGPLDFSQAQDLGRRRAAEVCNEPMLLAWFDRARGAFSPNITCCREDKPSWLTYAESRGGDIVICINDLEYVFVFTGL
jgi:hypothetical protein